MYTIFLFIISAYDIYLCMYGKRTARKITKNIIFYSGISIPENKAQI